MYKIAALVSGGGSNLQAVIDAVDAGKIKGRVALVVSSNAAAYALERAKKHEICAEVLAKKDFADSQSRENRLLELLHAHKIDLLALCGSLMILSGAFLEKFGKPVINVHPALLPDFGGKGFYGLNVHKAVLAAGSEVTGATVHFVESGIDTGKIILQKRVDIKPGDTPETLQERVMREAEWQILPEVISMFAEGRI